MERDTEANRYYDHARNHDFNLGRFLSPDGAQGKLLNPHSWNRYSHALNSPTNIVDPNGLEPFLAHAIARVFNSTAARSTVVGGQVYKIY